MRSSILSLLTCCALVVGYGGCRESDSAAPGKDSGGDSDSGNCPHACVSQLFCVQGNGIAHGEFDCAENDEICCELGAAGDTDPDTDSETDTGLEPCPFECMSVYQCYANGVEHEDYGCEEPDDVCCEVEEDTDTGYKGPSNHCLICEPDAKSSSRAAHGKRALQFLLDLMAGR